MQKTLEHIVKTICFIVCHIFFMASFSIAQDAPQKAEKKGPVVKKILETTTSSANKFFEKIRIKDLATFEGIRDNQLIGYGLVVGLNGSGDTLSSSPYTKESLVSMLERLGVNIRDGKIPSGKNVAAVMVTANLPAFARHGTKIDVTVSALGDAKDLRGGVLLVTPLYGADGEVYSVAQGNVSVSGLTAAGTNASITKGVPTAGTIVNGGIIEKEIDFDFQSLKTLNLSLRNPDFTTAERMTFKINTYFNEEIAKANDPSTIALKIPDHFKKNMIGFLTEVEQLRIRPDQTAKVVIDDTNGVIVVGKDVRISPVAITQGSITVTISEEPVMQQLGSINGDNNVVLLSSQSSEYSANKKNISPPNVTASESMSSLLKLQASRLDVLNKKFENEKKEIIESSSQETDQAKAEVEKSAKIKALEAKQKTEREEFEKENKSQIAKLNSVELEKYNANRKPIDQETENKPNPKFSTDANITEEKGKFTILDAGTNLEDVVNGLNSLGVTPKEMGSILRAIKASGALQADIKDI
ncbi:MAG: Flagellar P-ring protein [Holosporales bacterium]